MVVAPYDERRPSDDDSFTAAKFTDSFRRDICISLNLDVFIVLAGIVIDLIALFLGDAPADQLL